MTDENGGTVHNTGWVPLQRVALTPIFSRSRILQLGGQLGIVWIMAWIVFQWAPLWVRTLIALAVPVIILVLAAVIVRLRHPQVWVSLDVNQIRAGRHRADVRAVSTATLLVAQNRTRRALGLLLEDGAGLRAAVNLRDENDVVLDEREARTLLEVLSRSSIRMPMSADDPTGNFARFNFPGHLSKETARSLVEHPPRSNDPLPTPPRT